jgi:hypothetical protein
VLSFLDNSSFFLNIANFCRFVQAANNFDGWFGIGRIGDIFSGVTA